jgi:peptidoglycan/LPS O-acetylase OafA/YrhL
MENLQIVSRSKRFVVLDSWRGLCALLVAVHNLNFGPWLPQRSFVAHSSLFVDFFFVLSGFVISHAYEGRFVRLSDIAAFMLRRFGRLWPLHVAVLVCLIVLHFARFVIARSANLTLDADANGTHLLRTIATNLLFIQIFDVKSWLSWNAPSWSISTEFWTYLVFAIVCLFFSIKRMSNLVMGAIAASAAVLIFFRSPDFLETNTAFAFFRCLYGFCTGYLIYQVYKSFPTKIGSIAELPVILLVAGYVTYLGSGIASMMAPAIFGFAIWVFAHEEGVISRAMKTRPFIRLGTWSYSIYMVHWLLRNLLVRANEIIENLLARHLIPTGISLNRTLTQLTVTVLYLVTTVSIAAVTYRLIEQPGRKYFNGLAETLFASNSRNKGSSTA